MGDFNVMASLAQVAESAARAAAAALMTGFKSNAGVRSDLGKDIKTQADLAAEELLKRHLAKTGLPILSEEGGGCSLAEVRQRRHWIIDPLDGTLNFSRRFPMACVSVALWNGMQPELGVVADLERNRLLSGQVGRPADVPLRVSRTGDAGQAVLATGFPSGRTYDCGGLAAFVQQVQHFKKVRMIGSAALSLSYVAEGVFDAYCEEDIWIWDVAAGLALVLAAGGCFWMTPLNERGQVTVFASNGWIEPPETLFATHEGIEKYTHS